MRSPSQSGISGYVTGRPFGSTTVSSATRACVDEFGGGGQGWWPSVRLLALRVGASGDDHTTYRYRCVARFLPDARLPAMPGRSTMPAHAGTRAESVDSTSLIHARGLTKRFGDFTAVDAIDFDVAPGESFGFLGPNGAGKTSTMRMIGCVSPRSRGRCAILGQDPAADGPQIRARLGVVPQQDTLDTELTVRENLAASTAATSV